MSNDFIVLVQANLHKKSECNTDLALYADYLLKNYHIDNNNKVVRGMSTFDKKFKYNRQTKSTSQSTAPVGQPTTKGKVNKGQFYDENQTFQKELRKFLQKARNDSGCNGCPSPCSPATVTRPNGFICGLTEINYYNKKVATLSSSNLLFYDHSAPTVRAALWISNNIQAWPVRAYMDGDIATARIDCKVEGNKLDHFYVASVYMDINKPIISPKLKNLVDFCKKQQSQLIILADSNSHSVVWNEPNTNARGRAVEEFMANNALECLNVGNDITYHRYNAATIIDITLATGCLLYTSPSPRDS